MKEKKYKRYDRSEYDPEKDPWNPYRKIDNSEPFSKDPERHNMPFDGGSGHYV